MKDFIITSLQSWDMPIGGNAKDIAYEISRQHKVLYVNNSRKSASKTIRKINNNLWVLDCPFTLLPINFLPDGSLFDIINRWNNRKICQHILCAIKELQFKDYYLFIDNDIYHSFYAADYLHPKLSIYYRRDNMISAYWCKHAPRLEPLLCKKSNGVVANSSLWADNVRQYNSHTYNIGQGVYLEDYQANGIYPVPSEMQKIPHPIIGYIGWITGRRLDANLLFDVANQRPKYSFVLIGSEDNYFQEHPIHTLKNVHFLGQKKQKETIAYLANFDICINPQLFNEVTAGNYPRKIDEYLAMGKPVIATYTPAMELFKDYVSMCSNSAEYIKVIDQIIHNNNNEKREERILFAHTHNWSNSVNKLYDVINRILVDL